MSIFFQWILALVSFITAIIIIGFGIAGIAVAIGFLMIPSGIFYAVKGINNLINKTKTVITIDFNKPEHIIINPILEFFFGIILLFIGLSLTEAFIGIVLTGIGIFFLVYYFDKFISKK